MKNCLFIAFIGLVAFAPLAQTEELVLPKTVPSIQLSDLEGNMINTAELGLDGPIIISFWATWCAPCKKELNAINELYKDWQAETGVTLVAVSIDNEKTNRSVPVYVKAKGWNYLVLLDAKGDFKNGMGVVNVPHTFLVNTKGEVVYSHNSYAAGDEAKLFEQIKKLSTEQ
jgi:cytochrome c biogenesis protein CcmG/thiol:disulfide interchange protein DsbE